MRKMDEMELSIRLRAVKWTHIYVTVFLCAWMFYNLFTTSRCGPELLLLTTANLLLVTLQQIFTARLTGDRRPLRYLGTGLCGAVLLLVLGTLLLIAGPR